MKYHFPLANYGKFPDLHSVTFVYLNPLYKKSVKAFNEAKDD